MLGSSQLLPSANTPPGCCFLRKTARAWLLRLKSAAAPPANRVRTLRSRNRPTKPLDGPRRDHARTEPASQIR